MTTETLDDDTTAASDSHDPQWTIEEGKWTVDPDDEKGAFWPSGRSARRGMLRGHRVPNEARSRRQRKSPKQRAGEAKAKRRQKKRDEKHAATTKGDA